MNEISIELFGMFSVVLMVTFYGLENLGRIYVAAFSVACLLSAIYALMLGSYPFVFAETVWAVVAFKRYKSLAE